MQLRSGTASDRLDTGSIDSQTEAARSEGQATKDQLTQDLWKEQGIKGVEAVGTKQRIEHEESEAEKKSLTQQVMLEKLDLPNPESPKPKK